MSLTSAICGELPIWYGRYQRGWTPPDGNTPESVKRHGPHMVKHCAAFDTCGQLTKVFPHDGCGTPIIQELAFDNFLEAHPVAYCGVEQDGQAIYCSECR